MDLLDSGDVFEGIFVSEALRKTTDGGAWVRAMLAAEAALALAGARAGLFPLEDAEAIASVCRSVEADAGLSAEALALKARASGNPVPPLVERLTTAVREATGEEAARYVHRGATSQDVLDTAAMLVTRDAIGLILTDLDRLCAALAALADGHRATLMSGRTLMQHAVPTTFGLKAAGWLSSLVAAGQGLRRAGETLPAQLGGAAGTLASLGEPGIRVLEEFASELGLREAAVPWHTHRHPVAGVGGALSLTCGTVGKIAGDLVLLAQTEVGEVAEAPGGGRGGSSTLPHKRNPILSVTAVSAGRRGRAEAAALLGAMDHEHERAAGAWHAEWGTLTGALRYTGGAVALTREAVSGLEVNVRRMRENLGLTDGLLLAENLTTLAARNLGRLEAHERVGAACRRVLSGGGTLREEVAADSDLAAALGKDGAARALDPERYLGSAGEFVDRALDEYRTYLTERPEESE
ncbi:3-carboxy-cis,cis-muconate cycloisomerase [Rubrobacter indicoceani]|uniref:3-carboxy-cis,cis-muconate cycloisomerase n=1 Tax=Rubrobacter indicoceani TaxID=2051957 RepID=UPI001F08A924|nr:3-carboxy-cis,cis-muconate cycloisomerase [Rubrobacter indicoceani]